MAKVVIIGAGLTALSTAYHLEKKGIDQLYIFEKQERPGGLLRSVVKDGFTFDYTGHLLHCSDPYFKEFLIDIAGLQENFDLIERRAAIYTHDTFVHYPFQMNLYGLPIAVISDCITAFIERKKSKKKLMSFYDWVLYFFGAGFARHFFVPYNTKLLSYSIKKITPSWTGRFVPQTTIEAIIEGAVRDRYAGGVGYNSSFYYPKKGGIEYLIKRLTEKISSPIVTQAAVQMIDSKNKRLYFTNGEQCSYDYLVSTMPLDNLLLSLKEPSSSTLYKAIDKLLCTTVINSNIGFKGELRSDKHWIYFPEKKYAFYRLGLWHNISKQLTPDGFSSLYLESSFLKQKSSQQKIRLLTERAKEQAVTFIGRSFSEAVIDHTLQLDHAYVIYDQWRENNVTKLLEQLKNLGIYSIGRFGAWKYSSMQEAVLEGRECAQELLLTQEKNYKEQSLFFI